MLLSVSYVTFQELATRVSHRNTGKACGDPIADRMLARVAADENLHMMFYRNIVGAALDVAPDQAMRAIMKMLDELPDARRQHARLPPQRGADRQARHLRPAPAPRRRRDARAAQVARSSSATTSGPRARSCASGSRCSSPNSRAARRSSRNHATVRWPGRPRAAARNRPRGKRGESAPVVTTSNRRDTGALSAFGPSLRREPERDSTSSHGNSHQLVYPQGRSPPYRHASRHRSARRRSRHVPRERPPPDCSVLRLLWLHPAAVACRRWWGRRVGDPARWTSGALDIRRRVR